ncbi:DHHA2 domain-containing protein [Rubellicoccus peritrichatus]|uniref:inorganic diphosphatase n=1 Tax=Rubellicoccus peritrichatus TaxID=3080537 RepID=A0AAQ3LCM3_9BACT|nr:DHHA2 domain-containing protein [Puniceicoccus sp. CR14]WOO42007.1 DHH family phosphoesterase [Puniceicoccus sp. CR14]
MKYVTGHRNPDTDAIVSAHVLAWLLRKTKSDESIIPIRLGEPNPQTSWLFEKAGEQMPGLRMDCRPTAGDVAMKVQSVSRKTPLNAALRLIDKGHSEAIPVLEEDGTLIGLISNRSQRTNFLLQCNVEDMVGTLIGMEELSNGLGLIPLNEHKVSIGLKRVIIASFSPIHKEALRSGDVIFSGDNIEVIEGAGRAHASAVILADITHERAIEIADSAHVPVFYCPGSLVSAISRLGGCFPCEAAMETDFDYIDHTTPLTDCRTKLLRSSTPLPVMDEYRQLIGTLSIRRLLEVPAPQVALVDHFEATQSIDGLSEAEIFAIIDHHRVGDVQTLAPAEVDCRQWGSTATILTARAGEADITLPTSLSTLLLGAIVSDTLLFKSPTTTEHDRFWAKKLAEASQLDIEAFGLEVLRRNDRLGTADPDGLLLADCKQFTSDEKVFFVSQVETVDLGQLDEVKAGKFYEAMSALVTKTQASFGVVMITDVLKQFSRIELVCEKSSLIQELSPTGNAIWEEKGLVSRKKQMIPYLLNKLRTMIE